MILKQKRIDLAAINLFARYSFWISGKRIEMCSEKQLEAIRFDKKFQTCISEIKQPESNFWVSLLVFLCDFSVDFFFFFNLYSNFLIFSDYTKRREIFRTRVYFFFIIFFIFSKEKSGSWPMFVVKFVICNFFNFFRTLCNF